MAVHHRRRRISMKARFVFALILTVLVALPSIADERTGPVGRMSVSAASVDWQSSGSFDRLVLIVSTPDGNTITREFQGNRASFRAADLAPHAVADGTYLFELRAVPKISPEVKERLAAARADDDDAAVARIKTEVGGGGPRARGRAAPSRSTTARSSPTAWKRRTTARRRRSPRRRTPSPAS